MENLTRRKDLIAAGAIAVVTTAAVAIAKAIGAVIAGAFLAGAGTSLTAAYVIIANTMIKQARRNNEHTGE